MTNRRSSHHKPRTEPTGISSPTLPTATNNHDSPPAPASYPIPGLLLRWLPPPPIASPAASRAGTYDSSDGGITILPSATRTPTTDGGTMLTPQSQGDDTPPKTSLADSESAVLVSTTLQDSLADSASVVLVSTTL
jgi:hypothetical protein